jgi:hypothetical protein
MSTFWDRVNSDIKTLNNRGTKPVTKVKVKSAFWDRIKADTKSAPTLKASYKKANAEKLIELKDTCKVSDGKGGFKDNHHFIIPTGARRVIGQCQKCKGERWFNNYLETTFNGSPKTTEESQAENDALQDMEVQGTTVQGVA